MKGLQRLGLAAPSENNTTISYQGMERKVTLNSVEGFGARIEASAWPPAEYETPILEKPAHPFFEEKELRLLQDLIRLASSTQRDLQRLSGALPFAVVDFQRILAGIEQNLQRFSKISTEQQYHKFEEDFSHLCCEIRKLDSSIASTSQIFFYKNALSELLNMFTQLSYFAIPRAVQAYKPPVL